MSRRRYLSTDISLDAKVNLLAREHGDFAALFYTWLIPHASDDATIHGTTEELLFRILPGRRDKDESDVADALVAMEAVGLIEWDREHDVIYLPSGPFYRYQSYIKEANRRPEPEDKPRKRRADRKHSKVGEGSGVATKSAENAGEQREVTTIAENASSVSSSISVPSSSSISVPSSSSISSSISFSSSVPSSADGTDAEIIAVVDTLNLVEDRGITRDAATVQSIGRSLLIDERIDPVEVALDYVRWQNRIPEKERHRDLVRGYGNQMKRRKGNTAFFRPGPDDHAAFEIDDGDLPPSMVPAWDSARPLVIQSIRRGNYDEWFGRCIPRQDGESLVLTFPDDCTRQWAKRHHRQVTDALADAGYPDTTVSYEVAGEERVAS